MSPFLTLIGSSNSSTEHPPQSPIQFSGIPKQNSTDSKLSALNLWSLLANNWCIEFVDEKSLCHRLRSNSSGCPKKTRQVESFAGVPGLTEKSGKVGLCRPRLLSEAGQASSFPLEKPVENEENRGFRWESEPREDRREGGRDSGEQVSVRVRGERFVNAW